MRTTINDDKELTALVHELAMRKLKIAEAEAHVQAKVEAIKLAFDEVAGPSIKEVEEGEEIIREYCEVHRERLYTKNGKPIKTLKVLEHKLAFKTVSKVMAAGDVVAAIERRLGELALSLRTLVRTDAVAAAEAEIDLLNQLLRVPATELNKAVAAQELNDEWAADKLASVGVTLDTKESFLISYTLTPDGDA